MADHSPPAQQQGIQSHPLPIPLFSTGLASFLKRFHQLREAQIAGHRNRNADRVFGNGNRAAFGRDPERSFERRLLPSARSDGGRVCYERLMNPRRWHEVSRQSDVGGRGELQRKTYIPARHSALPRCVLDAPE